MQKRSLSQIFLYASLSLGVYELIWLHQTRQELMKLTAIRIPSIRWLAILNAIQIAGLASGIVLGILLLVNNSPPVVTPSCWAEYTLATAPETAGQHSVTSDCRNAVESSDAATNRENKLIKGFLSVAVLILVSNIGYPRWFRNYALAVQQVTKGHLSQTQTMAMLQFAPAYGMVAIQNLFNTIDVSSLNMGTATTPVSTENKTVHTILSIIAVSMVVVFGLFILALVLLNYIGTH
jgi:hypothetical protein